MCSLFFSPGRQILTRVHECAKQQVVNVDNETTACQTNCIGRILTQKRLVNLVFGAFDAIMTFDIMSDTLSRGSSEFSWRSSHVAIHSYIDTYRPKVVLPIPQAFPIHSENRRMVLMWNSHVVPVEALEMSN